MALGGDDNYKILISTDSDTKGVRATETALDRLRGSTDNSGASFLKMGAAVAAGQAAFAIANAAIHKAVGFLGDSVKAANEAEASQKQLEHAVIGVSHATKQQLKETENLADALEKKGVLDGDNIKLGLAQLSTFGLSNKAVQGLAGSLSDLAVNQFGVSASGEQLSDSANMIAKALNGQFGILEKSGIRFTKAQKNMIEYGTEMQKVQAINEGFAQNLKYTNDVALTTTEGKMAKLRVTVENVKESIGKAAVDGLGPFILKAVDFVNSVNWESVINKSVQAIKNLVTNIKELYTQAIVLYQQVFNYLTPGLERFWQIVSNVAGIIYNMLMPSLRAFYDTIKDRLMPQIIALWNILEPALTTVIKTVAILLGVQLVGMIWFAINALNVIISVFGAVIRTIGNVIAWIGNLFGAIIGVFQAIPSKVAAAFSGIEETIFGPFRRAFDSIKKGVDSVNQKVGSMKSGAANTAQRVLDPFKLLHKAAGGPVIAGQPYVVGDNPDGSMNSTSELFVPSQSGTIIKASDTKRAMGGNGGGGTTVNYNAPIYLQTAEATREFFNIIDRNTALSGKGLSVA